MNTIKLIIAYIRFNLAAAMEYRAAFLIQVIGMALNNGSFILFWIILYHHAGETIAGYNFTDVMFLWAMAPAGFGLSAVFFGNSFFISRLIYSGELDVYLLQPKPLLLNMLPARMLVSGWGDLFYGIILFIFTQPLTLLHTVLFVIFSLCAAAVLVGLRLCYSSLTFFFGNAEAFANMASDTVLSLMLYPGSIFKGKVVWLFHTVLPVAWIAFIPVNLMKEFRPALLAGVLAADALILMSGILLFRAGLKFYESGNRMGARL